VGREPSVVELVGQPTPGLIRGPSVFQHGGPFSNVPKKAWKKDIPARIALFRFLGFPRERGK